MEFFDNYECARKSWAFTADRVYNIDEIGMSAVAQLGTKQVGQAISGEQGTMITVCMVILYHQFSSFQEQDFMTH